MNKTAKKVASFILALALFLLVLELALRFVGYAPYGGKDPRMDINSAQFFDSVKGWRSSEGSTVKIAFKQNTKPFNETVLSSGKRATKIKNSFFQKPEFRKPQLVFLGCSFMFGFGVSDKDTLPWIIQNEMPEREVINFGTKGYGTYQNLLSMEEVVIKDLKNVFIYGFNDFHETRNILYPPIIRNVMRQNELKNFYVPYCDLDKKGELVRHAPKGFPEFPLRSSSAIISLIEDIYFSLKTIPYLLKKDRITKLLLIEMNNLAEDNGDKFIVLLQRLSLEKKKEYISFLKDNKIKYIDGVHPKQNEPEMQLSFDSHPNQKMYQYWAKLVVDYFGD